MDGKSGKLWKCGDLENLGRDKIDKNRVNLTILQNPPKPPLCTPPPPLFARDFQNFVKFVRFWQFWGGFWAIIFDRNRGKLFNPKISLLSPPPPLFARNCQNFVRLRDFGQIYAIENGRKSGQNIILQNHHQIIIFMPPLPLICSDLSKFWIICVICGILCDLNLPEIDGNHRHCRIIIAIIMTIKLPKSTIKVL